ncbi:tetratricopeptide repeat protein [Paludisphaera mucosa]|uniref:Tetratricopeptide repeat protein n=1 Tax=Paludisphaera mucosa TaxID=3030827 RepID=A0ABT6FKL9_9BACT|nr:tetratricopeptide repeat protein [Paludisphaera mucosa]MDG3008115.1 tetratricopeptide repeat protein [Paludisphaera mucosa]
MGPKTLRRLAFAAVVLVLGVVSVFLLQRYQVSRMGRSNLARAVQAEKAGDLAKAEELYLQHVLVFPQDQESQLSYARVLLERSKTPARIGQVVQIYREILSRSPGRDDVRRLFTEKIVEYGGNNKDDWNAARSNLTLLLRKTPDDGDLAYLMGRVQVKDGDPKAALASFQAAVTHHARSRIDARQQMAALYRGEALNQPEEADRVIDEMVKEEPGDYRVHLERGRYRKKYGKDLAAVAADFQEASRLAPQEPGPYIELSQLALERTPPDAAEAARIVKQGLAAAPKSGLLYRQAAFQEFRAGDVGAGLKIIRQGLEALPDDAELRVTLAEVLARQGATAELRDQSQELARIGIGLYPDYFAACAYVNARDWASAKRILLERLAPQDLSFNLPFRSKVSYLLAQCYGNLGDDDRRRTALASAVRDDPDNVQARVAWIAEIAGQGQADKALDEYREMAVKVGTARPQLASLLIDRYKQQPDPAKRDWKGVEALIDQIAKDDPTSSQAPYLRAQMLTARGLSDDAAALLAAARAKAPRDPAAFTLWIASADIKAAKRDWPAAFALLDEARDVLKVDSLELRLARVKYLTARGGPDVAASLVALTRGVEGLPIQQRIALLETVGDELLRLGDTAQASAIWARYAEIAPNDLRPRSNALSLALQTKADLTPEEAARARADIEKALAEVRRVEGAEGPVGRHGEIKLLLWRARVSKDAAEKLRLHAETRTLLAELRSRRPDWYVVPLTTAELEEQELAEAKGEDRRRRVGRLADLYAQIIEMGQTNIAVVRRATELLMEADRTAEIAPLWAKVPVLNNDSRSSVDFERSILDNVIAKKEYANAEKIVRQRVAARPDDFPERLLLVQLLLTQKKADEAESELRQAVAAAPADPSRRISLVQYLVAGGQIDKAEQAAAQVERAVAPDRVPPTMAACSDLLVQGCQATAREAQKVKWLAAAKGWYAKAQAAKPGDFAIKRTYVEHLLRTSQVDEVEKELTAILKAAADPAKAVNPADVAWAKRTLALTYVARSELTGDYQQALKARNLYAPPGQADVKLPEEAEDLRVLSRVYAAQKIIPYRIKAVAILEKLEAQRQANDEDRFLLARIYRAEGRWDRAHKLFGEIVTESRNPSTSQELNQRVGRLAYYASDLIAHVQGDDNREDADEAQTLVDRLRKLQPDAFNVLALQARLDKANGKIDEATRRIKEIADRPQLAPALARAIGALAENLGLLDMAEGVFKRNAVSSARLPDQLEYAAFLGRRGRVKEALDVCEPLWKASPNPEPVAPTVISVLLSSHEYKDAVQIARVSGWIERSLEQKPNSPLLIIALGTIRDREQRYSEAVELYRRAVGQSGGEVIPLNNLAWLLTLQGEKGAGPLEMINKAIALRGPIPEFLDTRAVVYLTNGEARRAVEDLENAVAIDPSASRHFHLARAYLAAGDLEAARRNMVIAREKGLGDADVHPLERDALAQVEKALK